eukprot:9419434-Alexandrium_andersonii.AAC.1
MVDASDANTEHTLMEGRARVAIPRADKGKNTFWGKRQRVRKATQPRTLCERRAASMGRA